MCRNCVGINNFTVQIISMAASTALFIDKYHPKANGECAITIKVTHDRKKKYYPTGITMTPADFEKVQGDKPRKEFKEIALKLQSFEKKAADVIKELQIFTFAAFEKRYYTDKSAKEYISGAFAAYAKELREAGRIGTAVSYECAQSSLNKFAPSIKFADVTPELLHRYEKWMLANGNKITTVGIYLRPLRALFNSAIADGQLTKEYYPFGKKKYEIPTGNNVKKAISISEIARIYHFRSENSATEKAKDFWFFMYLCNGINVKDFCLLRYENIKGEILEFERAKTARTKRNVEPIRIPLSEDAKAIIEKWGNIKVNDKTFVFPILENGLTPERERQLIQQLTQVINCHLRDIAKTLEIHSKLTTYAARHSFATIMQRSGASAEFISEALGHSNVKTTQNYLAGFEDDSKKEFAKALTSFKN